MEESKLEKFKCIAEETAYEILDLLEKEKHGDYSIDLLDKLKFNYTRVSPYDFINERKNIMILSGEYDVEDEENKEYSYYNKHCIMSTLFIDTELNLALVDFYNEYFNIEYYSDESIDTKFTLEDLENYFGGKRGYYRYSDSISLRTYKDLIEVIPNINFEEGRENMLTSHRLIVRGKMNESRRNNFYF